MMKKSKFIFLAIFLLQLTCLQGQSSVDSIKLRNYLEVKHTDASRWVNRYESDIETYRKKNKELTDRTCDVLFLGSSSINLWDNIEKDLAPLKIIRRSYGGAAIRDMLYNYDVITRGFDPKAIAVYVENDLAGVKEDLTIGETFDFYRLLLIKLAEDFPRKKIVVMSFKPSYSRIKMVEKQKLINTLLDEWCAGKNNFCYVDVASCMYGTNGKLREDIFKQDKLHMNQTGYDLWTSVLKPKLLEFCGK